jgi:hypothetical protein
VTFLLRTLEFAGRAGELAVLGEAFTGAASGMSAVILLGAEAGGGNSLLAAEFAAQVAGRPARADRVGRLALGR